ncbi:hypothetical protein G7K71_14960 [Desulfofundulus sp. TPOSR]|uniref:hypothetical protein n=1 Tax=Desulfofundulus sp. TPOSR TaxID=2714340 RepID=UPI001409654A|nr:hypothetical protein [Desulfofundulus sp. TPOSR]NHM28250.1 hypothetical protein [Desulfofundulus sp. TPOSR]
MLYREGPAFPIVSPPACLSNYLLGRHAGAAEKERPEDAIALYKELVEEAIGRRQRGAYREAAGYLCRIKTLCQRTGAQEEWEDYLAALRRKYVRFPALQEELDGAGL